MDATRLILSAAVGLALLAAPAITGAHETRRTKRHETLHRNLDARRDARDDKHRGLHEWLDRRHEQFHDVIKPGDRNYKRRHQAFHARQGQRHELNHAKGAARREAMRDAHERFHDRALRDFGGNFASLPSGPRTFGPPRFVPPPFATGLAGNCGAISPRQIPPPFYRQFFESAGPCGCTVAAMQNVPPPFYRDFFEATRHCQFSHLMAHPGESLVAYRHRLVDARNALRAEYLRVRANGREHRARDLAGAVRTLDRRISTVDRRLASVYGSSFATGSLASGRVGLPALGGRNALAYNYGFANPDPTLADAALILAPLLGLVSR
jgi:hypothetical protein